MKTRSSVKAQFSALYITPGCVDTLQRLQNTASHSGDAHEVMRRMGVDKCGHNFQSVKKVKNMVALWIASHLTKTRRDFLNWLSYDFVFSAITTVA